MFEVIELKLSKPEIDALQFEEIRKQNLKMYIDMDGKLRRGTPPNYYKEGTGTTNDPVRFTVKSWFKKWKENLGIKSWGDIIATLFLGSILVCSVCIIGWLAWTIIYYRLMQ